MENESYRIMVVDDEVTARVSLGEVLRLQGYDVVLAESGEHALKQLVGQPPFDLMIVDLKMPGMDGLQLTISVQDRSPETVIILLTAFGSLETAIEAIRRGAHDYLLKPCPIPQILDSVRKGLVKRRQEQQRRGLVVRLEQTLNELVAVERGEEIDFSVVETPEDVLHVREVELNRDRHSVTVDGEPVNLTPTEFKLLACMMERPDQVCSPQELIRNAQGYEADPWGARAIVRVHIRRLRRKLEPDPVHPTYIVNVRGVGYMFPSEPQEEAQADEDEDEEDED
jgi:DNA-binding response OmpR family regulator